MNHSGVSPSLALIPFWLNRGKFIMFQRQQQGMQGSVLGARPILYLVWRGASGVRMRAIERGSLLAVRSLSVLAGMAIASCGGRIVISICWIPS